MLLNNSALVAVWIVCTEKGKSKQGNKGGLVKIRMHLLPVDDFDSCVTCQTVN